MTESNQTSTAKRAYKKGADRRQEIAGAVLSILSAPRLEKFTTKEIAAQVGVSEACLYRHFASKADILMMLVDFCDQSFRAMFAEVEANSAYPTQLAKSAAKLSCLLSFASANPGLVRLLTGEAIAYESDRVQERVVGTIRRAELSIKETLKQAAVVGEIPAHTNVGLRANIIMSIAQGRWRRFTESGFKDDPLAGRLGLEALVMAY